MENGLKSVPFFHAAVVCLILYFPAYWGPFVVVLNHSLYLATLTSLQIFHQRYLKYIMALDKGNISTNGTSMHPYPSPSTDHNPGTEHDSIQDAGMNKVQTTASIQLSPEMFEKLYLSPPTKTSNDMVRRVGNPTPIALIGFVLATTPLSMDLMKWRGAAGTGAWGTGMILFFGGFMMALGGLFEVCRFLAEKLTLVCQ